MIGKITSQELLTDPKRAPESATSVSTSLIGSLAHGWFVTLSGPPSAISSLVLSLVFIFQIPHTHNRKLKVPMNAEERP